MPSPDHIAILNVGAVVPMVGTLLQVLLEFHALIVRRAWFKNSKPITLPPQNKAII